jgi:hypothetical protein
MIASRSPPLGRSANRLVGVCRHFTVLLVAMLRAAGVPARARCGFGAYFNAGRFEDHWVCEYWNSAAGRWVSRRRADGRGQRSQLTIDFDVLDVPRDRFVIAGHAWAQCRSGNGDPASYGIFDLRGLWFVAGNVMRDFAALNNMEMLPWDVWGAMPRREEPSKDDQLALIDRIAALTRAPDAAFADCKLCTRATTDCACPPPSSMRCGSAPKRFLTGEKEIAMKLYAFPPSPNTWKVRAFAHQLGVPLELEIVDLTKAPSASRITWPSTPRDARRRWSTAISSCGSRARSCSIWPARRNRRCGPMTPSRAPTSCAGRAGTCSTGAGQADLHLREPRQADLEDRRARPEGAGAGARCSTRKAPCSTSTWEHIPTSSTTR